jgi:ubiquinone/menaquinone biosynthesis C-methylase UbiE
MGTAYGIANDEDSFNAYYERPGTISLLGDVTGLRVLDAGCGPGALSKWLVDNGATVTAMDVSPEMVRLARQRMGDRARILTADLAEPLTFLADASADLVVASLVLHYVADWAAPLAEFRRVLTPGGAVVFSTHHPAMDWQLHSRDDYFDVTFWRRPLTAITAAISGAGFVIDRLVEPEPSPELRQRDPQSYDKIRSRPTFLFFRLIKRSCPDSTTS